MIICLHRFSGNQKRNVRIAPNRCSKLRFFENKVVRFRRFRQTEIRFFVLHGPLIVCHSNKMTSHKYMDMKVRNQHDSKPKRHRYLRKK